MLGPSGSQIQGYEHSEGKNQGRLGQVVLVVFRFGVPDRSLTGTQWGQGRACTLRYGLELCLWPSWNLRDDGSTHIT